MARGYLLRLPATLLALAAPVAAQTPPGSVPLPTAAVPLTAEQQIASAVLALPAPQRAGATVLGYDSSLRLVRLRQGTGGMTCLADDPRDERFHVACYHDSLEAFMARGRELRAQGMRGPAVDSIRNADIVAGRLRMPAVGSLYSLTAPAANYDATTNTVRDGRPLFVLYVPFATVESTGVPATPGRAPWLMNPGTPRAHIMITPDM